MDRKVVLLLFLMHSLVSIYVFKSVNVLSVFPPFGELHTAQIFSDLAVSISLVMIFIGIEMQRLRKPMWPLVLVFIGAILLGSFSPLIFLLIRKDLFVI